MVKLSDGRRITYDFLVVAAGLSVNVDRVEGLSAALADSASGVSTNYSPFHVEQTWRNIQALAKGGPGSTALFTFPNRCAFGVGVGVGLDLRRCRPSPSSGGFAVARVPCTAP